MACTVAVEDTIVTHYNDQIREIIAQGKENEYQELLHVRLFTASRLFYLPFHFLSFMLRQLYLSCIVLPIQ